MGRFAVGNPGGPGSPYRSQVHKLKAQFLAAATTERVAELIEILWAKALNDQEQWAIIEVLNRLYGKPKETIKVDTTEDPGDALEVLRDTGVTDALAAYRRRTTGAEMVGPGSGST